MGAHISCARLANATSRLGALGVVSGVGLRHIVAEQVRAGDAVAIELAKTFPIASYVEDLLSFAKGGSRHTKPVPMDVPDRAKNVVSHRLAVIGAYVEVMRAKSGHKGKVGINVMWKCALTVLPTIYGAMLGGVDALLCGAGVPMELNEIVTTLREGGNLEFSPLFGTGTRVYLDVSGDPAADLLARFEEPKVLPILSNYAFPKRMMDIWERTRGGAKPFAFVLEHYAAGGHNAPPRNKVAFGEADDINGYFDKVLGMGVPVYVAGAFEHGGTRKDFEYWTGRGAYGIQVGSRFALSHESGLRPDLKEQVVAANAEGSSEVETDLVLSPTGYPFKVVKLPGTLSDTEVYHSRTRICNRGYLLTGKIETRDDGTEEEVYLCPSMPERQYAHLGGHAEDLDGRICLCNALLSTAGFYTDKEKPLVTLGVSGKQTVESLPARAIVEDILTPEYVAQKEAELRLS